MKTAALSLLLATAALCATVGACAQSVPLPTQDGVYLLAQGRWERMYLASASGVHVSGAMKTALSYGAASVKTVLTFRDATAPVATSAARPIFCIVGPSQTAPRDIVIVQLKRKKDRRELQIGKANAYTGASVEYPPGDVTEVTVTESGDGLTLTAAADLKPGEYILFAGAPVQMPTGYGGYDFSERPSR